MGERKNWTRETSSVQETGLQTEQGGVKVMFASDHSSNGKFFFQPCSPQQQGIQVLQGGTHVAHRLPWHDRVAHAASWQRARKMPSLKYPQSHSLTACSCRWQTLLTSDPLAKGNVQAGALWKPLSSSTRCLDQYSPCLFTLLFWAPWRGTAAKPYLGIGSGGDRMRAGGVIYAQGKGTPAHEGSVYKSRGSTGLPTWRLSLGFSQREPWGQVTITTSNRLAASWHKDPNFRGRDS